MWLWVLVSLATGGGAIALGFAGIIQASALLGTAGYPGAFPTSPLGLRTLAVMAACIGLLVAAGAMALTGLFALFGVRAATALYAVATFAGFLLAAGATLLAIPQSYDDPVSTFGVDHNGQPLGGLPMWGAALVMLMFLATLALTRPTYRYALAR